MRYCDGNAGHKDLQTSVGPKRKSNSRNQSGLQSAGPSTLPTYRLSANLGGSEFDFMNGDGRWLI